MKNALFGIGFLSFYFFIAASICHAQNPAAPSPVSKLTLDVPPPRYLPGTSNDASLTRMLWVDHTHFIQLPQGFSNEVGAAILSIADMQTGKKIPLTKINAVIRETWRPDKDNGFSLGSDGQTTGVIFSPFQAQLSPDARWLLWATCDAAQPKGNLTWTAMTLDGKERRDWPRHVNGGVGWMRDSIHFVEISQEGNERHLIRHASVCSLDTDRIQEFPIDVPVHNVFLTFSRSDVLFTENGCGWVSEMYGSRYEIIPGVERWTLRDAPMLSAITLAEGDHVTDWAISPSGDWLVWRDNAGDIPKRSHTYISRPDGSEARIIFVCDTFLPAGDVCGPQWTADEQGIVFNQSGFNPETNGIGPGLYLISLSQTEAKLPRRSTLIAGLSRHRGLFPTSKKLKPQVQLARVASTTPK